MQHQEIHHYMVTPWGQCTCGKALFTPITDEDYKEFWDKGKLEQFVQCTCGISLIVVYRNNGDIDISQIDKDHTTRKFWGWTHAHRN